jgi:hypothetical protein
MAGIQITSPAKGAYASPCRLSSCTLVAVSNMLQKNWGKDIDKMRVCDRMSQQVLFACGTKEGAWVFEKVQSLTEISLRGQDALALPPARSFLPELSSRFPIVPLWRQVIEVQGVAIYKTVFQGIAQLVHGQHFHFVFYKKSQVLPVKEINAVTFAQAFYKPNRTVGAAAADGGRLSSAISTRKRPKKRLPYPLHRSHVPARKRKIPQAVLQSPALRPGKKGGCFDRSKPGFQAKNLRATGVDIPRFMLQNKNKHRT